MNHNRLLIAVVVLAVLAAVLVGQMRSHEASTSLEKPVVTLPELKRDAITKITIDNPEKKLKVTLEKSGDSFRLTEPLAAKADATAADAMLDKLSDLKVASVAATRKENHEKVGVDAAHGIHLQAFEGDKLALDVIIGESKSSGTMLRKPNEDVVVAVRGSMRYAFDKELKYLRDRNITDADPDTITQVALTSPKGSFKFEKVEDKWTQPKGEKPIKDFAPSKVQGLVSSFAKLRASDFAAPETTLATAGLESPTATLVLTPKEGEPIRIELGAQSGEGDNYYLHASTSDVLYQVSKYTGDRLLADAQAFSEPPKPAGEANAGKGLPVAGGGDLPPEILKQLQQQGAMGGAHAAH